MYNPSVRAMIAFSHSLFLIPVCWCLRVLDEAGGGGRVVYAEVGQELSLSCAYDLEEDVLHSLKWYRGDKEFYRYLPRGECDDQCVPEPDGRDNHVIMR